MGTFILSLLLVHCLLNFNAFFSDVSLCSVNINSSSSLSIAAWGESRGKACTGTTSMWSY